MVALGGAIGVQAIKMTTLKSNKAWDTLKFIIALPMVKGENGER